jgi:hypothetical protein
MSKQLRIFYAVSLVLVISLFLPQIAYAREDDSGSGPSTTMLVFSGVMLVLTIGLLYQVLTDARNRGANVILWFLIILIFGPVGLIAWLLTRPKGDLVTCAACGKRKLQDQLCPHCAAQAA